ncbi:unnamed protein product [Paramecium octaurelia]|uniref:Uncharacterized protein n=1 Tax=Paramecium octaurelia TaxID=43137 RepID=A0A8S1V4E8_PAROT|nr:unnamed protein product [Paramecium octaurelia]
MDKNSNSNVLGRKQIINKYCKLSKAKNNNDKKLLIRIEVLITLQNSLQNWTGNEKYQEYSSNIKNTNSRLNWDMQILKQKKHYFTRGNEEFEKFLHIQFDQINHKLQQFDIITGAIPQHKKFKRTLFQLQQISLNIQLPNSCKNDLHFLEINLNQSIFKLNKQDIDDQEQIKALFEELRNISKPIHYE